MQHIGYNGPKRKYALKFEALVSPGGLVLQAAGPMEGRKYDWALYIQGGFDEQFGDKLCVDGLQYYAYGDSGFNEK